MVVHLLQNEVEKKVVFFEKMFVFYKIYVICRKKYFYMEKKNFIEKNINKSVNKIYLTSEIYFYTENVCVTNKRSIFLKCMFIQ